MSRPTKRARVVPAQGDRAPTSSSAATKREPLFAPFRSLGHVSTGVPLVVQSRASKYLDKPAITLITSLGRSWAMWDGHSMKLLFVGEPTRRAGQKQTSKLTLRRIPQARTPEKS